jgi:hypothetical protein
LIFENLNSKIIDEYNSCDLGTQKFFLDPSFELITSDLTAQADQTKTRHFEVTYFEGYKTKHGLIDF